MPAEKEKDMSKGEINFLGLKNQGERNFVRRLEMNGFDCQFKGKPLWFAEVVQIDLRPNYDNSSLRNLRASLYAKGQRAEQVTVIYAQGEPSMMIVEGKMWREDNTPEGEIGWDYSHLIAANPDDLFWASDKGRRDNQIYPNNGLLLDLTGMIATEQNRMTRGTLILRKVGPEVLIEPIWSRDAMQRG